LDMPLTAGLVTREEPSSMQMAACLGALRKIQPEAVAVFG
jgi:hypothetical protein